MLDGILWPQRFRRPKTRIIPLPEPAFQNQVDSETRPQERDDLAQEQPHLEVVMCRYVDGKLEREIRPVHQTEFIAISHVWGDNVAWQTVAGVDGEILVSSEKKAFLHEEMPSVVGDSYFWMDILCVNQRDKAARVDVTQHIPTIFRRAVKTIVVRDSVGFQPCCFEAMGSPGDENLVDSDNMFRLVDHASAIHELDDFSDGVLSRLWVFQEIMLSDVVQFVRCPRSKIGRVVSPITSRLNYIFYIIAFYENLWMMTTSWIWYGLEPPYYEKWPRYRPEHNLGFIKAFCDTTTVTSRPPRPNLLPMYPGKRYFQHQLQSTRCTSKARDFILAIMPQYGFYKVPSDAKSMTFTQLFLDCCDQLSGYPELVPLIRFDGQTICDSFTLSCPVKTIAEPVYLSDFAHLLFGPTIPAKGRIFPVQVKGAAQLDMFDVIRLIRKSNFRSQVVWQHAKTIDLLATMDGPERISAQLCSIPAILHAAATETVLDELTSCSFKIETLVEEFRKIIEDPSKDMENLPRKRSWNKIKAGTNYAAATAVRLAAVISCGLGFNSCEWSERELIPVVVKFGSEKILALVPMFVLERTRLKRTKFLLVEANPYMSKTAPRYVLVAETPSSGGELGWVPCLFPPEIVPIKRRNWKNWILRQP
jgi:hypothetical protein